MKVLSVIYFLSQSTDCFGLHVALQVHTLASWFWYQYFQNSFVGTQTLFSSLQLMFSMDLGVSPKIQYFVFEIRGDTFCGPFVLIFFSILHREVPLSVLIHPQSLIFQTEKIIKLLQAGKRDIRDCECYVTSNVGRCSDRAVMFRPWEYVKGTLVVE